MLFMSVNEVLTKTFFADGKTLVPMISSIISMTLNVILVVSLSSVIGVGGIALISGIATVVNCTVNYLVMKKDVYKRQTVNSPTLFIISGASVTFMK